MNNSTKSSAQSPNWENFKYLLKHKKDVYLAGRELGAPPLQLLLHDYSKFFPNNWKAYRDFWFGEKGIQNPNGWDPEVYKKFREAAEKHYNTEKHHLHKRKNPTNLLDIPLDIRKEIVSDWYAVSKHLEDKKQKGPYPKIKTWLKQRGYEYLVKESSSKFWKYIAPKLAKNPNKQSTIKLLEDYLPYAGEDKDVVIRAIKGYKQWKSPHLNQIKTAGKKPQWIFDAIANGDIDLLRRAGKKSARNRKSKNAKTKLNEIITQLQIDLTRPKSNSYPKLTKKYIQENFSKKDIELLQQHLNHPDTQHFLNHKDL